MMDVVMDLIIFPSCLMFVLGIFLGLVRLSLLSVFYCLRQVFRIQQNSRKLFWMNILMFWPRNFIFMVEGEELKLQECFVQDRIEEQG